MEYIKVSEAAKRWGLSERSVRNYCAEGKIPGALRCGKAWQIPADTEKPCRKIRKQLTLAEILKEEKNNRLSGGIYHKLQIELTYNSNHIEGSSLTHEQTRFIFETATIGQSDTALNVDDIIETANHFRCIDFVIDRASHELTQSFMKELHAMLKSGTSDSRKNWFAVGEYKKLPNEVGGNKTTPPEEVAEAIKKLLSDYNSGKTKDLHNLLEFHVRFERIHPFQDGNGRIGRLILLKECLKHNIVPFIIGEDLKFYYYRGLQQWDSEPGFLTGTCETARDRFKTYLDYFKIPYKDQP